MSTSKSVSESNKTSERLSKDEKNWAVFCHLGGLFGYIFPPANIIAPLVIWLMYRDEFSLVNDQGKEAVNFQISLTIYLIASAILIFLVIGLFLIIGLFAFSIIITIIAAVRSSEGVHFRYPLTIRFIQ